jgi:hypothetical protein
VGLVLLPPARILVILKGVEVGAFSLRFVAVDFSLVDAAVVEDVPSLDGGLSCPEAALVVGAFFEKELAFAIEGVVLPLAPVKALWLLCFLVVI